MKTLINGSRRNFVLSLLFVIGMGSSLTLVSCEDIIDSIADCVINRRPNLPDKDLEVGYLDKNYYDELKASIVNEPYDDDYYYNFKIMGQLPNGIESWVDGRKVVFSGRPLQTGTFYIKINLIVTPYYEEGGLCDKTISKDYILLIMEQAGFLQCLNFKF